MPTCALAGAVRWVELRNVAPHGLGQAARPCPAAINARFRADHAAQSKVRLRPARIRLMPVMRSIG